MRLLSIFLLVFSLLGHALKGQTINFPDENFLEYLLLNTTVDSNNDGEIDVTEAEAYDGSIILNTPIVDARGIEYFKNITTFVIYKAQIPSIDLSNNTQLEIISIQLSPLKSLDLSKNKKLIQLEVQYNSDLTTINLNENTDLQYFSVMYNAVTSLNLSTCTNLTYLYAASNKLTTVDVSKSPRLSELNVSANSLSSIDVSNNKRLSYLHIGSNNISQLDVTNNPLLNILFVQSNPLTKIDVSNNKYLTQFVIDGTKITDIDLSPLDMLQYFYANNSQLKTIDGSKNPNLIYIAAQQNNLLEYVNFKNGKNTNVYGFFTTSSPNLKCIQVDDPDYSSSQKLWEKDETAVYSQDCTSVLSTNELEVKKNYIYPNPTNGDLNFTQKIFKVEIYLITGQLIRTFFNTQRIDISNLNKGVYIVRTFDESSQNIQSTKIIKN